MKEFSKKSTLRYCMNLNEYFFKAKILYLLTFLVIVHSVEDRRLNIALATSKIDNLSSFHLLRSHPLTFCFINLPFLISLIIPTLNSDFFVSWLLFYFEHFVKVVGALVHFLLVLLSFLLQEVLHVPCVYH